MLNITQKLKEITCNTCSSKRWTTFFILYKTDYKCRFHKAVFLNLFPHIPLTQYKTCTLPIRPANVNAYFQDTDIPGFCAGSAGLKSSNLPTGTITTLCKHQISKVLLFKLNAISQQRRVCIFSSTVKLSYAF